MNIVIMISCAIAILCGVMQAMARSSPSVASPLPVPIYLLQLICAIPPPVASFLPAAAFLAWQPELWRSDRPTNEIRFPVRTWSLFAALTVFSFLAFISGAHFGIQYQGATYVIGCAAISAGLAIASGACCFIAQVTNNVIAIILANALVFYWGATYACPSLGEML